MDNLLSSYIHKKPLSFPETINHLCIFGGHGGASWISWALPSSHEGMLMDPILWGLQKWPQLLWFNIAVTTSLKKAATRPWVLISWDISCPFLVPGSILFHHELAHYVCSIRTMRNYRLSVCFQRTHPVTTLPLIASLNTEVSRRWLRCWWACCLVTDFYPENMPGTNVPRKLILFSSEIWGKGEGTILPL